MAFQYDVDSAYLGGNPNTVGPLVSGRARVKQIMFVGNGTAGTIALYDGTGTSGQLIWQSKTSSGLQPFQVLVPGEGLLANTGVYVTSTNVLSVSICYG